MDAFELLKQDHRRIEALFDAYENAADPASRLGAVQKIGVELTVHGRIEEEFFYAALRRARETAPLVRDSIMQHDEVDECLGELQSCDSEDWSWQHRLEELRELVQSHIRVEEQTLFSRAVEVFSLDVWRALGTRMEVRRRALLAKSAPVFGQQGQGPWYTGEGENVDAVLGEAGDVADRINDFAQALHHAAVNLEVQRNASFAHYTEQMATTLDQVSVSLRNYDLEQLIGQTEDLAKRQPALFLGGALSAGLVISHFINRVPGHGVEESAPAADKRG